MQRYFLSSSLFLLLLAGSVLGTTNSCGQTLKKQRMTPATSKSIFQKKTLANGLEIIVVENHLAPIATVVYVAKNGSFTEPDEFAGLSHLYEHMFFKKNKVIASEDDFNERNRELGMSNNASTGEEVVEYHFTMPAAQLKEGIEFMSFAIKSPAFDSGDIEREREVVLGEFDRNEADPFFALSRATDSAMWGDLLVRKEPLGQRPVIKAATPPKMFAIQHKFYIPNNSALLISGDVDPQQVYKLVEQYLGDWERGPAPFPTYLPPPFAPLKKQLIVREAPDVPIVAVSLNYFGPSVGKDDENTYCADLFSTIVNSSTSHLYKALVDSGLAQVVSMSYYTQQNTGPITIQLQAVPSKAKPAIAKLQEEMTHWMSPDYYTDQEMHNAAEKLAIQRLYDQENPASFITSSGSFAWAITGLDYYTHYIENVRSVTREQLNQYLAKYVIGQPYVMAVGASKPTLDALQLKATEVLK
jgi:zinc protease